MPKLLAEDSRLHGYDGRVTHAILPLERTYCSQCGKPYGWASQDCSEHIAAAEIIVYCEECFTALNNLAPMPLRRLPPEDQQRLGFLED